jgi:proteic killer suppression protein
MEISFKERYLLELEKFGRTNDKSHRFQPEVIEKYKKLIRSMRAAPHVGVLLHRRSLHFKYLQGDKKGQCSIRVDDKYRITFTVSTRDTEPVITVCEILKLSNHYD